MGRLWQTILLIASYPLFEYLPFETIISKNQKAYYKALSNSDKKGESTEFIEFMLNTINTALEELSGERIEPLTNEDRITLFLAANKSPFSRKDYLNYFKSISTATASRDLNKAVKEKRIKKMGEKNKTIYTIIN